MVYDTSRSKAIVFSDSLNERSRDLWEWDGLMWTQYISQVSPRGRASHGLAYDSLRRRTVLFGGDFRDDRIGRTFLADTWEWDGSHWREMTPTTAPLARMGPAMAYDAARGVTLLFGGNVHGAHQSDTWQWNGTDWSQLFVREAAMRSPVA